MRVHALHIGAWVLYEPATCWYYVGLPLVRRELLRAGLTRERVEDIMGEIARRAYEAHQAVAPMISRMALDADDL